MKLHAFSVPANVAGDGITWMGVVGDPACGAEAPCPACGQPTMDARTNGWGATFLECRACGHREPVRRRTAAEVDTPAPPVVAPPAPALLPVQALHADDWLESVPHEWVRARDLGPVWGVCASAALWRCRQLIEAGRLELRPIPPGRSSPARMTWWVRRVTP